MKPFVPEPLPIRGIDWLVLTPLIGKANRYLGLFDGILCSLPSPDALLSPLTTQEAVLSSRIEGTEADLEEVLKFEAGEEISEESRRLDIKEILNYRRALRRSENLLKKKPFGLNTLLGLHAILLDSVRGYNKGRGRFRTVQNWIGPEGAPIEQATFVPPDPLFLMSHMSDWEEYYHSDESDPLVQLAVLHAQFEIIHPFVDGNGRIGRMLVPLFLYEKKLLTRPNFFLSAYLEAHRDEYAHRLREIGQPGSWNRWVEFFLEAIAVQAEENTTKAKAIQALYERLKEQVIELTNSRFAVPMLDQIFERPIFRSRDFKRLTNMPSNPMVMTIIKKLRDAGILKVLREGKGRRPQIVALAELINLCEGKKVI